MDHGGKLARLGSIVLDGELKYLAPTLITKFNAS